MHGDDYARINNLSEHSALVDSNFKSPFQQPKRRSSEIQITLRGDLGTLVFHLRSCHYQIYRASLICIIEFNMDPTSKLYPALAAKKMETAQDSTYLCDYNICNDEVHDKVIEKKSILTLVLDLVVQGAMVVKLLRLENDRFDRVCAAYISYPGRRI
jgi:hypothetical protein